MRLRPVKLCGFSRLPYFPSLPIFDVGVRLRSHAWADAPGEIAVESATHAPGRDLEKWSQSCTLRKTGRHSGACAGCKPAPTSRHSNRHHTSSCHREVAAIKQVAAELHSAENGTRFCGRPVNPGGGGHQKPRGPPFPAGPAFTFHARRPAGWRPAVASPGTPWLCPRLAEAAGAMDGPAARKTRTARSRRSRRRTGRTGRCCRRATPCQPGTGSCRPARRSHTAARAAR